MILFSVITLFPQMIHDVVKYGVLGQALKKGLVEVKTLNPRDFTFDTHKTIDDRPFGGGDGMVMKADVLDRVFSHIVNEKSYVVYMTPQGRKLDESKVLELAKQEQIILLSGRYAGVDQRVINKWVDEEISMGDFVLSGGEIPSLALIDAVSRKIPNVLGDFQSAQKDSFATGLLEAPLFTRPAIFEEDSVPEVLREGHAAKIQLWQENLSQIVTLLKRPDLLKDLSEPEKAELMRYFYEMSDKDKKACGFDAERK